MQQALAGRRRALLVDPNPGRWIWLKTAIPELNVETCSEFQIARQSLLNTPPDILVTNLRLGDYNGLHLVYLSQVNRPAPLALTYGSLIDLPLIREAQQIGAFFEAPDKVLYALQAFLKAGLPAHDRRQPRAFDRRREYRGGRRATDTALQTV